MPIAPAPLLVLFDIDGTLLRSLRIGLRSMARAFEEVHGVRPEFEGVPVGGRLDPLIHGDLAERSGVRLDDDARAAFRTRYAAIMSEAFADPATQPSTALDGARELVDAVDRHESMQVGVLTGNWEETAALKLRGAGFDPSVFAVRAFGDDGPTRRDLVPVAIERHALRHGGAVAPERVVVIGDTEHDVDCALHHGARVIAVATGGVPRATLEVHRPTVALDDLADHQSVLSVLDAMHRGTA